MAKLVFHISYTKKRKVISTVQRPDFQHFRQHFGNEHYCMYNITHLDKRQFFVHFWKLQNLCFCLVPIICSPNTYERKKIFMCLIRINTGGEKKNQKTFALPGFDTAKACPKQWFVLQKQYTIHLNQHGTNNLAICRCLFQ